MREVLHSTLKSLFLGPADQLQGLMSQYVPHFYFDLLSEILLHIEPGDPLYVAVCPEPAGFLDAARSWRQDRLLCDGVPGV